MRALFVCIREGESQKARSIGEITSSPLLISTAEIMLVWFFITVISFIGVVNTMVCSSGTLMQKR